MVVGFGHNYQQFVVSDGSAVTRNVWLRHLQRIINFTTIKLRYF